MFAKEKPWESGALPDAYPDALVVVIPGLSSFPDAVLDVFAKEKPWESGALPDAYPDAVPDVVLDVFTKEKPWVSATTRASATRQVVRGVCP
ncbi:MAG: hypothetical protein AB1766_00395 [Pseudomonadota bacterium]